MSYSKVRTFDIKGEKGSEFLIELYFKDTSVSLVENKPLFGSGFSITWGGQGKTRNKTFFKSDCKLNLLIENDVDEAMIYELLNAGEQKGFIIIKKGSNNDIFWFGYLNTSIDSLSNAGYPYEVQLLATDSIGSYELRQEDLLSNDSTYTNSKSINNHIRDFLDAMNINTIKDKFSANDDDTIFKTAIDWWRQGDTTDSDDPFDLYYTSSAPFRKNKESEPLKYKKFDVLKGSLSVFNTNCMLVNGNYYFTQPNSVKDNTNGTQNYISYTNNETDNGTSADETHILTINQNQNNLLNGSKLLFEPNFKNVSCNFINGSNVLEALGGVDITNLITIGIIQATTNFSNQLFLNWSSIRQERFLQSELGFLPSSLEYGRQNEGHIQIILENATDTYYLRRIADGSLFWAQTSTQSEQILPYIAGNFTAYSLLDANQFTVNSGLSGVPDVTTGVFADTGSTVFVNVNMTFNYQFPLPSIPITGELKIKQVSNANTYFPISGAIVTGSSSTVTTFATGYPKVLSQQIYVSSVNSENQNNQTQQGTAFGAAPRGLLLFIILN